MMIGEPEAILLDEPFSALDGYLKDILQKDMQEFLKDYKGDMLMVTHSRDEAFRFCRELMLLKEGKTLTFGETRKIFEQPGLLEASRLTGCKNNSRIERLGDYEIFALDWGVALKTSQKVEPDMTHVAIRDTGCAARKKREKTVSPFRRRNTWKRLLNTNIWLNVREQEKGCCGGCARKADLEKRRTKTFPPIFTCPLNI